MKLIEEPILKVILFWF